MFVSQLWWTKGGEADKLKLTKWICDWFWLMVRYLFNKCHQGDEARYKKINKTKGGIVTVRNAWIFLSHKGDKSHYNK